jgi:hypothetical protein
MSVLARRTQNEILNRGYDARRRLRRLFGLA